MAWTSAATATQLTSITTEQTFDAKPTLSPGESAHVAIDVNFPSTPTDNAIISVYSSVDGTNYDDVPMFTILVSNAIDPSQVSFVVSGVYQFEVTVQRDGTTDTLTSADMTYRTDGISV